MKKFYLYIVVFVCASVTIQAQNKDTKKADKLFKNLAYADAVQEYTRLVEIGKGGPYVYTQLAKSHEILNDTKQAESYYKKVVKNRKATPEPEILYAYAQTLKANGKADEYATWMNMFVEKSPNDPKAKLFSSNPNYLNEIMAMEPGFIVENMGEINTEFADFGSFVKDNTLYFTSSRNEKRKNHNLNDQPFLDIYAATIDGSSLGTPELLEGDVNTKYHEGTSVISPDGNTMYFDRNDYYKKRFDKSNKGVNQINLYSAEKVGGKWTNIQSAPFNNDNYSTGHPALSPDGKTLYFSSDMPGGKGGSDIYKVSVNNGSFGTPQAVTSINTTGTDVFPFVASDGTLYFSSDTHLGLGGLDVFSTSENAGTYTTPKNLGPAVNSLGDDFAFYLDPEAMTGYVSSNREGGKGSDDIYELKQLEPAIVDVNLTVKDEEGEVIPEPKIEITNITEGTTEIIDATTAGTHFFHSKQNSEYKITVSAEGYENETRTIAVGEEVPTDGDFILKRKEREKVEPIVVDTTPAVEQTTVITATEVIINPPIYFDFDKWNIRPDATLVLDRLVQVMTDDPTMIISAESHTDSRGPSSYNLTLSQKRAKSMKEYVIAKGIDPSRISGVGKGESDPAVTCDGPCTKEEHQLNRRCIFKIIRK